MANKVVFHPNNSAIEIVFELVKKHQGKLMDFFTKNQKRPQMYFA